MHRILCNKITNPFLEASKKRNNNLYNKILLNDILDNYFPSYKSTKTTQNYTLYNNTDYISNPFSASFTDKRNNLYDKILLDDILDEYFPTYEVIKKK